MFKRANWQTETIIQGVSRVPVWQAHLAVWMAGLAGGMFIVGLLRSSSILKTSFDRAPEPVLLMSLGFAGFTMFFPLPYIVYLAKELQKTKDRLEQLEVKQA